jgi:hypothetical protein
MRLSPNDLTIGKLYQGYWMLFSGDIRHDIWLNKEFLPSRILQRGGTLIQTTCFMLLAKAQDRDELTWSFKILTHNGEVGWAHFSIGTHWFEKLNEKP